MPLTPQPDVVLPGIMELALEVPAQHGDTLARDQLLGTDLSLVNRKASTTRHSILGVIHGEGHQISLLDTPGLLDAPEYALHERMMKAEEKAAKLPATLTVPLVLFILPSLFVVLLGPAVLSTIDNLINM